MEHAVGHGQRSFCRVATLALFACALTAEAQIGVDWKAVGHVGGAVQGIAVQGNHAYAGVGTRFVALDVSDPSDLREVGATAPFPAPVEDLSLEGSTAYVADGAAGLRVFDISNPVAPIEVGAWDSRGYAHGVAIDDGIAYLADGAFGLRLLDISSSSQPAELGSAYTTHYAFGVAVQGDYAYIAAAGAGLLIADVSDPGHPVEIASLMTHGYAWGVAVEGTTVCLADGWDGVKMIDVSDPAHPVLEGAYKTPGWAFDATITGTTAYVADAFGGLRVLDVSNKANPVETGSSRVSGGHAGGVAVAGTVAFVADRNRGVRAVNLAAVPEMPELGAFHPMAYADGVMVSGSYAFVAEANTGFFVIDISDPTRPRQVGSLAVDGNPKDVAAKGHFVFLTTKGAGSAGLHVIDVSDPAHPTRAGFYKISNGQPKSLDISGDHIYIAIETGLEILNISDPSQPSRAAFLRTHEGDIETLVGVTVSGTFAYVSLERGGLAIVDVSDPTNPARRGSFNPGPAFLIRNIAVSASGAYVADTGMGLRVLDVSDPSHPFEIGSLRTAGPQSVALDGTLAYLACGDAGLVVADISDPTRPALAGGYRTPGYTRGVVLAEGRVFLADGPNGLLVLEKIARESSIGRVNEKGEAAVRDPVPTPEGSHPHSLRPAEFRPKRAVAAVIRAPSATATTCVVTSVSDSGAGTLRECLQNAGAGTTITFDAAVFPPAAPASIRLLSGLPGVSAGITIDGSDAGVILDGSDVSIPAGSSMVPGLFVRHDGNKIYGLQVVRFPGTGIQVPGSHNVIGGDRSLGRGPIGHGNVISANRDAGIMITGDGGTASENVVAGNYVGTDASGSVAMGNGMDGIWIQRAANNRIGGPDVRDRNVVSSNRLTGIILSGESNENAVEGNYVGTDATGTFALGNGMSGTMIALAAFGNLLQGNLISGNIGAGVGIDDQGSSYNEIVGNRIGTDATGTRAIPNGNHGVWINETLSAFNRIGGTRPEERNLVSGNLLYGMAINSSGNVVLGNFVGTDITGRKPVGNGDVGVNFSRSPNMLGGATAEESNVIAANGGVGVGVSGSYSTIIGNYIGTDPSAHAALGNSLIGVALGGSDSIVQSNVIAHTTRSADRGRGAGISFGPELTCTIRRNSIHDNEGAGIEIVAGPAAPIITSATVSSVTGTACRRCEVEIFSDSEDEGGRFEGSAVADGSGVFTFTKPLGYLFGPNITATATDLDGRTSAFSAPVKRPPKPPRHRAVVR